MATSSTARTTELARLRKTRGVIARRRGQKWDGTQHDIEVMDTRRETENEAFAGASALRGGTWARYEPDTNGTDAFLRSDVVFS